MAKQVLVPPLGTTVDTVTLVSWYKAEGEVIRKGEPLFVIETDKANLDVESPASGVLRGVNAAPGDEIKALTVIAFIAEVDEAVSVAEHPKTVVDDKVIETVSRPELAVAKNAGGRIFISPRARRLADANHIPIVQLSATGPEGAIIERDVRQYLLSQEVSDPQVTTVPSVESAIPMQQLDRSRVEVTAVSSQNVSNTTSFTITAEAEITQLAGWHRKLLETNSKPTFNSLLLFAIGQALKANPYLRPEIEESAVSSSQHVDISLAVASKRLFLFPVIHNVDQKGLTQLAAEERDLMAQAAAGSMPAQASDPCTLRLCNLGEYRIDTFTPWFSAPGCTVLGVGRIKEQRDMRDGQVSIRQMVWLSLTADIRQMDGLPAAQFMQDLVRYLENPTLLIGI